MDSLVPTIDASYRRYLDLVLRHHQLLLANHPEDPEAETVEEEMTALWESLDAAQRRSLAGLSSDLTWIRRQCQLAPRGRSAAEVNRDDLQALVDARTQKDWHAVLHYLRGCASKISAFQLAQLRGAAWNALGFPALASVFYTVASELEPSNGSLAMLALRATAQSDPERAFVEAEAILNDPFRHPAPVVTLAASLRLQGLESRGRPIERDRWASLLHNTLQRLDLEAAPNAERATAYHLAARSLESLDLLAEASACHDTALQLAPDSALFWVAKGLFLYGRLDESAAEAFHQAMRLDPSLVWPYFFLAHYHLSRKHFEECLTLAVKAWVRTNSAAVRAVLLEWDAICQRNLGYPEEMVQAGFARALALNPTNERLQENLRRFEESRSSQQPVNFAVEPPQLLKEHHGLEAPLPDLAA